MASTVSSNKSSAKSSAKTSPQQGPQKAPTTPPQQKSPPLNAWNATAVEFQPEWMRKMRRIRYKPTELKALKRPVGERVLGDRIDHAPFQRIPRTLVPFLDLRNFTEFIELDYDEVTTTQVERMFPAEDQHLRSYDAFDPTADAATNYYCVECATSSKPCQAIRTVVKSVQDRERKNVVSAFLLQSPNVVVNSLLLLQVFDGKRTSMKMRNLKEKFPGVVGKVKSYLCGDGFHLAPPAVTAHDKWSQLMEELKFTWIRDNRTRIFTELSKQWKKHHTPFEQFLHFFFYRNDMPAHPTKGMLTHRQKPVIIAIIAGDVDATVKLCELGFEVPSDLLWDRLPYFKEALEPKVYCVLRHLCVSYYRRQLDRAANEAR